MKTLSGLVEIADSYDLYMIDLWGCVHNGAELFPNAQDCLQRLRANGRKVCLLSNAPRRIETVAASLTANFGLEQGVDYDHLMTSGEQTWCALQEPKRYGLSEHINGRTFCYYGPAMNRGIVEGLKDWSEGGVEDADCLIVAAPLSTDDSPSDARAVLDLALQRNLPLICANPDMGVVVSDTYGHCAGAIAALYAELGGTVILFGKPHPDVYQTLLQVAGFNGNISRILAIGDGLKTDIRGANKFGCGSCLLSTGLISQSLEPSSISIEIQVQQFARAEQVSSDWFLQDLRWS